MSTARLVRLRNLLLRTRVRSAIKRLGLAATIGLVFLWLATEIAQARGIHATDAWRRQVSFVIARGTITVMSRPWIVPIRPSPYWDVDVRWRPADETSLINRWGGRREWRPYFSMWDSPRRAWMLVVPAWMPPALAFMLTIIALRVHAIIRRRVATDTCPHCGYPRQGLASPETPCPECGETQSSPPSPSTSPTAR